MKHTIKQKSQRCIRIFFFFDKNDLFSNVSIVFSKDCDIISEMIFSWVKTKIILHLLNLMEEDVELL